MAIMDRTALFSDGQSVTATTFSTHVEDLGSHDIDYSRDTGLGTAIPLEVAVTQSFNNLTSLTISVETDDTAAFSSPTTVFTSPAYTLAQVAAGAKYLLPDALPAGIAERYVRMKYTVSGTAPTTGKITVGVCAARQSA